MLKDALNFFVQNIILEILDMLFPPVCGICGRFNKNWICKRCYKSLNTLKVLNNIRKLNEEVFYDEIFYLFDYRGIIRTKILKYKFKNESYLSNLFSKIILKDKICCRKIKQYDIIIPVPMHKKKEKQRGYNQTELITKLICEKLSIEQDVGNLIKIKNTKTQSTLSKLERKENIKNAFYINNKEKFKDKKIIIFDDIFTTGETVNEISKILKNAGVKEILIFVLARD